MKVGYARISTKHQDHDSQAHALAQAGIHPAAVYSEQESGRADTLPVLESVLSRLQPGDELVVIRLDRLTRKGAFGLHAILRRVEERGARVRSLSEPWCDPSSPFYEVLVSIAGWFAAQEAERIRARSREGLEAARARGCRLGRRPSLTPEQAQTARELIAARAKTIKEVARLFGVHKSTIQRALKATP